MSNNKADLPNNHANGGIGMLSREDVDKILNSPELFDQTQKDNINYYFESYWDYFYDSLIDDLIQIQQKLKDLHDTTPPVSRSRVRTASNGDEIDSAFPDLDEENSTSISPPDDSVIISEQPLPQKREEEQPAENAKILFATLIKCLRDTPAKTSKLSKTQLAQNKTIGKIKDAANNLSKINLHGWNVPQIDKWNKVIRFLAEILNPIFDTLFHHYKDGNRHLLFNSHKVFVNDVCLEVETKIKQSVPQI